MAIPNAKNHIFLRLAISLLLLCCFPTQSYSAPFCFGMLGCNNGGRRLPYLPPPPVGNKEIRQDDPRAPPASGQFAPPSPSTIEENKG